VFASRRPDPVLQQLESSSRGDVSVNDAFIPVSRYFDRIERAEQLIPAALAAMRVLTSQADTGAVTLALPQDVQAEAFDYPAEFIIGIGTRYTDFTTASRTAFQNPDVRFVNINVAELDSHKLGGIPLTGDARATLESLDQRLQGWSVADEYRREYEQLRAEWDAEVSRLYNVGHAPLPAQSEVLGAVNDLSAPRDVVVCAAGSMPGDLHKLWRTRDVKGYH